MSQPAYIRGSAVASGGTAAVLRTLPPRDTAMQVVSGGGAAVDWSAGEARLTVDEAASPWSLERLRFEMAATAWGAGLGGAAWDVVGQRPATGALVSAAAVWPWARATWNR